MPHATRARLITMRHAGLILLCILLVPSASAHAVLLTADPPPNGHGDENLTVVELTFTEDVLREYTDADVVDLQGESWREGAVEFDETDAHILRVHSRALPSGLYAVNWKALSIDTHTTRGSFIFAVGNATIRGQGYEVVTDVPDQGAVLRDGFARFAFYLGLFLAAGMPLFALAVLRGGAEGVPRSLHATAAAFGLVGAAGAFVALLFLGERTGLGFGALGTAPGRSFVTRGAFVLGAALASVLAILRPSAWRLASGLAVGAGIGAVLATSLGSHAAATKDFTTLLIAADALHLAMGAVWIGGVVAFLHVGWGRGAVDVGTMITRFSPYALGSVIVLLATGFAASVAHMPCALEGPRACFEALRTENYVRLVALKLALMLPLIALGAFHKYRAGPGLSSGRCSPAKFRRVIQVEALIMVVVLGAAGVLAATAPPAREMDSGPPLSRILEFQNNTKLSHVILQITPNPVTVGAQEIVVIVHPLGAQLPNATEVALKIWPADEEEPELTMNPTKATPNEWDLSGGLFTRAGDWNVLVILQRPDEYVKLRYVVPVVNPGAASS